MIGTKLLSLLKPGTVLLNTSRGSVADPAALKAAIAERRLSAVVLDVWPGEPNIDLDLLDKVDLATPHVAGYSYDGKVNGTRRVLEALCRHFGLKRDWDPSPLMPPAAKPHVRIPAGVAPEEALRRAIAAAYDIEAEDARLRAIADEKPDRRGKFFEALRKNYPVRREFPETTVEQAAPDAQLEKMLIALGFPVRHGTGAND
jgi:erythronate-4-phosphate dehydrogenase